ncbi:MAG: hypothetical protein K9K88_11230 [Desulfobacterales bacterium]|nr:hypothetical protein [Desulfobacterales bacterium]
MTNFVKTNPPLNCCRFSNAVFSAAYKITSSGTQIASSIAGCKHLERRHTRKSLRNGTSARFRIAAVIVFAVIFLISGPALALDHDFGEVEVGSTSTVDLDITSLKAGMDLDISLELLPAAETDLIEDEANLSEANFSLPQSTIPVSAGQTVQFQVAFNPKAVGLCKANLQVSWGDIQLATVGLTGTGIASTATAPEDLSPMAAAMQRWASAVASRECNGKTIGDRVQECIESADNHGEAVRCVAKLAAQLRKERRISRWDAWEMRDYAAKSRYHHMHKKHWMHKKADFRETHEKKGRRWSNWD